MKPKPSFRGQPDQRSGAALVVTLIVCTVLAMVVVAMMQNTTLDRASSRGHANHYRAKLAAQSGLAQVQSIIAEATRGNRAFIVSETNHAAGYSPVLLIGSNEATAVTNMLPLISGPISDYMTNRPYASFLEDYLAVRTNTNSQVTVDLNVGRAIQSAGIPASYRAPWIYLTNITTNSSGPQTNLSRFAYVVLDEQARLNPLLHRGLSTTQRTNFGRSGEEIRVDSDALPVISSQQEVNEIINASNRLVTPQTLALLMSADYESFKHLLSIHTAIDEDIIPAGYLNASTNFVPYADAGKPKYNINDLATDSSPAQGRATNIAGIISRNLPEFTERDMGSRLANLDSQLYPTRIAASVVDYVDGDTEPTIGLNGEPAGRELAPYVVMVAEKNTWTDEQPAAPAPPPVTVTIRTQFYVQLWNPHTQPVSGTLGLRVLRRQDLVLPGGGVEEALADYEPGDIEIDPPLQPNEMRAFAFAVQDQNFVNAGGRPSALPANYPRWDATSSSSVALNGHPHFRVTLNGALLDMNRQAPEMPPPANSGLVRSPTGNTLGPVGAIRWSFNWCPPNSINTVGDPRANFITESDWAGAANLGTARWQGRQADVSGRSQNFLNLWSRRDFVRANLAFGQALAGDDEEPTEIPTAYEASDARNAPVFLRNAPMLSAAELGQIFDAAQVDDSGGNPPGASQGFFRPVGGRSLRIGQPETPYWDVGGRRAAQLLDLFTVNPLGTNTAELGSTMYTNVPIMRGRVNANTAPEEVLAAVFDGLEITSDEAIGSPKVDARAIAQAIITNRPYSRLSDLNKATAAFANGDNYDPEVANISVTISNATTSSTNTYIAMAAMDRAREEIFARSANLLGTQSRAFRVFVIGESLDRSSNPLSRVGLEASLQLQPLEDGGGFSQIIKMKKEL